MILYTGSYITFQEVPDEVSLTLTISNCQGACPGCHSPWLREDIGDDLEKDLPGLLDHYGDSITCVCFMGEGNDPEALMRCIESVKEFGLKTALYSGDSASSSSPPAVCEWIVNKYGDCWFGSFDYLKVGHYDKNLGGLDDPSTNQRMWNLVSEDDGITWRDITHKFRKKRE